MRTPILTLTALLACTGGAGDTSDTSDTSDTGDTADTSETGDPPGSCVWSVTSTLPGAGIEGGSVSCDWTLAAADAGVDVPWVLTITEPRDVAVDMVSCVSVDASGLRFREYVSAEPSGAAADTWCPRCDVGICPIDEETYTTAVGTWPSTFTWRPRQWAGPSDYGAQPGELFPAGTYTLVVRASGTLLADDSPWVVELTAPVTLRE